jgi:hypothetical protein
VVALGGFTSYQELENFLQDGVDARRNPAGGEFFHPLSFRRRRRVNLYRPKYTRRVQELVQRAAVGGHFQRPVRGNVVAC